MALAWRVVPTVGSFLLMVGTVLVVAQYLPWAALTPSPTVDSYTELVPDARTQDIPSLQPVVQLVSENARQLGSHTQELNDLRDTVLQQAQELARLKTLLRDTQQAAQDQARHTATLARTAVKQQLRQQPHAQIVERPIPWGQVQ